jgi:hypothetical protein
MDVFWVLTLISLAAVPLALALRKVKLAGLPRWRTDRDGLRLLARRIEDYALIGVKVLARLTMRV